MHALTNAATAFVKANGKPHNTKLFVEPIMP